MERKLLLHLHLLVNASSYLLMELTMSYRIVDLKTKSKNLLLVMVLILFMTLSEVMYLMSLFDVLLGMVVYWSLDLLLDEFQALARTCLL